MTEPLLKIVARFDITEDPKHPLNGRAYLSAYNFKQAYNSDLVYAVKSLREVVDSPALNPARHGEFKHTVALMWGLPDVNNPKYDYHQMVDFLAWNFNDWKDNAEIFGWQTKDGKRFETQYGIYPVTCEGGLEILRAEKEFRRRSGVDIKQFKQIGPSAEPLGILYDFDFCTNEGRQNLKKIMQNESFVI